jgi:site-specific recombinase XerD
MSEAAADAPVNAPAGGELVRREDLALELQQLAGRAGEYAAASHAAATRSAYTTAWADFAAWCDVHGVRALPASAEAVALYVADLAGALATSTLNRRLVAIAHAHTAAGHPDPTDAPAVRQVWRGVRRTHGVAAQGKAPLLVGQLRAALTDLPDSVLTARDRALLLIGFAGAMRRSELVALDAGDIALTDDGLVVTIRRGKTDQEARGRVVGIPHGARPDTNPVRAWIAWRDAAGITDGPVFRPVTRHGRIGAGRLSDRAVARVVKAAAVRAGLDPAGYAGHSLRAGFVTSAAAAHVEERLIQMQTGHRSLPTLRGYIRDGRLFHDNAAALVGL